MKKDFFCASEFIIVGNEIWYVPLGYRYLCCYNLKEKKMKEQFLIPQNRKQITLYESMIFYKHSIICIPYTADYFLIFHLKERKFEFLEVEPYKTRRIGFYANFIYKNFMYFIPRTREGFIKESSILGKLDLETKQITYNYIQKKKESKIENFFKCLFRRELLIMDNEVLLLDGEKGIIKFNLIENDNFIGKVNQLCLHKKFSTICRMTENLICLSDDAGNVICCDLHSYIFKEVKNNVENFIPIRNNFWYSECFSYSIQYRDIMFLFPAEANKVLQFNINEMTISEAVFSEKICVIHENTQYSCGQFSKPYIMGNTLFVWNIWNEMFYTINLDTNEVEEMLIEVIMPLEQLRESYIDCCNESGIMRESNTLYSGVELMINYLPVENSRTQISVDKLVGEDIWSKLKK